VTPTPESKQKNNEKDEHKTTRWTTTITTVTLYFAGYTTTITTKNDKGEKTTFATYIPPSTVLVVKRVAVTAPVNKNDFSISDSTTALRNFNSHGLWGVIMSLAVVSTTLVFMIFS